MTYIPNFHTVLSRYLSCCVDAQITSVDVQGEKLPVSITPNNVSLLGYVKPDTEEQQEYFISAPQSPDN